MDDVLRAVVNLGVGGLGYGVGLFTVGQVLLILDFGIPLTIRLKNKEVFSSWVPLWRYCGSILFQLIVVVGICLGVQYLFPTKLLPLIIGIAISAFQMSWFSGGQTREDTLQDFVDHNRRFFSVDITERTNAELKEYFNLTETRAAQGNQFFAQCVGNLFTNSILAVGGTLLAIGIGQWMWWPGFLISCLFATITAFTTIYTLVATVLIFVLALYSLVSRAKEEYLAPTEMLWNFAAVPVRVAEVSIYIYLILLLAEFFLPEYFFLSLPFRFASLAR
jgi:hypothetical protein